jgi:glucans biosynthesis protein C
MHEVTVRPSTRRRLYVDNLRVALTVLVVLDHVAVTYSHVALWYYSDPAEGGWGTAFTTFAEVNQIFFMGFFFLISGFFVPGAHDRKGGGRFARDRLVRLGLPLVLFLLVIRPVLTLPKAVHSDLPYWKFYLFTWDPGPTWFLEVLLTFALCYALLRRLRPEPRPSTGYGRAPGGPTIVAFVLILTGLTFAWRLVVPLGSYLPILGLPTPAYLPQYVTMFVAGTLAYRHGWFTGLSRKAGLVGGITALVAAVVLIPLFTRTTGLVQDLSHAAFESIFSTSVCVALLVLFRDHADGQGRVARFLSGNAFAVYVLHPLVVVGLGYAFGGTGLPGALKFLLAALLAVPLSWGLAAAARAVPVGRRIF